MKLLVILLSLTISVNLNAQNRKSLLKKINNFKSKTYLNAHYVADYYEFRKTLHDYFIDEGFKQSHSLDSSYMVFQKKVQLSSTNVQKERNGLPYDYSDELLRIQVHLTTNYAGARKIEIFEQIIDGRDRFTASYDKRILGNTSFNDYKLYCYLYEKYVHKELDYPSEIVSMINHYNQKETNERKKLVKGRDY